MKERKRVPLMKHRVRRVDAFSFIRPNVAFVASSLVTNAYRTYSCSVAIPRLV